MNRKLFCYGTLLNPKILQHFIGKPLKKEPATLLGYARYQLKGRCFPGIKADPAASVEGMVVSGLSLPTLRSLDDYEGMLYWRRQVKIATPSGRTEIAYSYVIRPRFFWLFTRQPWNLQQFEQEAFSRYFRRLKNDLPISAPRQSAPIE